jgi:hypothetical protein
MNNRHSTSIRLPIEIKEWAENRSIRNHRSMSAEIVAILSAIRDGEKAGSGFEKFANPSGISGDTPLFVGASHA